MKKFVIFSILLALPLLFNALSANAATMVLYQGAPPSGASVTFDGSSQITVSGFSGTLRVDYVRHNPWEMWSRPFTAPLTFSTEYADEIVIGFYLSYYPYTQVAHYYIYY
jgi:hypothetical protein